MALPTPDHVVIVMMENHGYNEVVNAPYIASLAAQGALMTNSFGVDHPSEPNYLALFAGNTFGRGDLQYGPITAPNLGGFLLAAGDTFGAYIEGAGTPLSHGNYDRDHAPWDLFTDVPTSLLRDYSQLPTDFTQLPTVSIITPNLIHDMHDGTVTQGDNWLKNNVDAYAQWAKTHNSLLILHWDEDDGSQNNQVCTILVGQAVKPGQYADRINHYNILRTIEDMYGLPKAGQSANVLPLASVWATTVTNPPAAPTNLLASSGVGSINLTWTNNDPATASFPIERSPDGTTFTQLAVVGGAATSYRDAGLVPSTTYYYRVRAANAAGNSGYSNIATATTPAAIPPAAPSNLIAAPASASGINLGWTNNDPNATSVRVESSPDQLTWTQIAALAGSISFYRDTGLVAGTTYYYRVRASSSAGDSGYSNVAVGTTPVPSVIPSAPSNLVATPTGAGSINLSWLNNATNAVAVRIQQSTDGVIFKYLYTAYPPESAHTVAGLMPGAKYYYRVRATNAAGGSQWSNTASAATTGLPAPVNVMAIGVSVSEIDLAWTNTVTNATNIRVQRSLDGVSFKYLRTLPPSATSFADAGLTAGQTYYYRLRYYAGGLYGLWAGANATTALSTTTTAPPGTLAGPVTGLHYAPNANIVGGAYVPAAAGFNLADAGSIDEVNALPAGVRALVWAGDNPGGGVTAAFIAAMTPYLGNPKVYGFYLADEPNPAVIPPAALAARSDWIHKNFPGAVTFIVLYNTGNDLAPSFGGYSAANTHIDLFGVDPYPVQTQFGGANYAIIPLAVQTAIAAGIPLVAIVPVYQAFGGGGFAGWVLPTAAQLQQILATWGSVVPAPPFDYAYSWGVQSNDTALVSSPALQSVFAAHNAP